MNTVLDMTKQDFLDLSREIAAQYCNDSCGDEARAEDVVVHYYDAAADGDRIYAHKAVLAWRDATGFTRVFETQAVTPFRLIRVSVMVISDRYEVTYDEGDGGD